MQFYQLFKAYGLFLVAFPLSVAAGFGNTHQGSVELGGNIIESACAIHPDSHQQTLILKDASADRFAKLGHGELHPFSIKLFNCSIGRSNGQSWKGFFITFYGIADGENFRLSGSSQGLALEILDESGLRAKPGIAMPAHPVPYGETSMKYYLRLVGNAKLLRGGDHFASLNYKLDYY